MSDQASSAQVDRFVHDRLPAASAWPILRYDQPELRLPEHCNIARALLDDAPMHGWGGRPMLRSAARTLTYDEARVEVDRLCRVLVQDLGVVPGQRVLLRGGNSIQMALAWLAVVKIGAISVATMPLLRARELGDIIDKAQPVLALCDARLLADLEQARAEHPVLARIVAFHAGDAPDSLEAMRPAIRAFSRPAPPPRTTSRCWPSPPAPPASPRPRCTPIVTCWRPARPGPATC